MNGADANGDDHSLHGRGASGGGPADPDCDCRLDDDLLAACAAAGCGFCRATADRIRERVTENSVLIGPVRAFGPPCAFQSEWATLLVGEAPNRWMGSDPSRARHVLFREDLADLAGLTTIDYYRCFARCNLIDYWPGRSGGGSAFPAREAARVADELVPLLEERFRRVVLIGRRVAKAFGPGPATQPWFTWSSCTDFDLAVVPHPSKVSRWWNDEANVEQARAFWTQLGRDTVLPAIEAERGRRRKAAREAVR